MLNTEGMVQLRDLDGRPLPKVGERLTVQAPQSSDVLGILLEKPDLLREFARVASLSLDEEMQRAENDESLSVEEQDNCIKNVLLSQALLIGLEAYAQSPDRDFLELLDDLNTTLNLLGPAGGAMEAVLAPAKKAFALEDLESLPLLPEEYPHAVACVLQQADRVNVEVGAAAEERLKWAGYRLPPVLKSPLFPSRAALLPPATKVPERMSAEQELRKLAQSALEAERNAALLLLYVNARDRLEDAPLVGVLDLAQVLILRLSRHHKELGTDSTMTNRLAFWQEQLHQQLGRPHLPQAQRAKRHPSGHLDAETRQACRRLRALRARRQGAVGRVTEHQLRAMWLCLDALDMRLAAGEDPDQNQELKVTLLLNTLLALTSVARVPGMSLPAVIEAAVRISDIDPLWAWEKTQPQAVYQHLLREELQALVECLMLLRLDEPSSGLGDRIRRLTRRAAGHLFANTRRAGLRLPEQSMLETYFQQFGSLQALPLSTAEWRATNLELLDLLMALSEYQQSSAGEGAAPDEVSDTDLEGSSDQGHHICPPVEVPAEAGSESADAPIPLQVAAAREHLRGRRIVLLGGVPRPDHHAALVRALELRELDWIGSDEYAHGTHAHARVTEDTALVILAIRWMGHAHNTLRDIARDMNVPYVMHPGGLSPNSVAWQIMHQASRQLEARATRLVSQGVPGSS